MRLWDLSHQLSTLQAPGKGTGGASGRGEPLHTLTCHTEEGFGLDWSNVVPGLLASADCSGKVRAIHRAVEMCLGEGTKSRCTCSFGKDWNGVAPIPPRWPENATTHVLPPH